MVDDLARPGGRRITLGVDRAYDTRDFVSGLRDRYVTPHVAQHTSGHRVRKRIKEVFGWVKSAAGQGKARFRGLARIRFAFTLTVAAYNLIRLSRLLETG